MTNESTHQMRRTVRRLIRGVTDPTVASLILGNWAKMATAGRLKPLYGSIFETIVTPGSNPYFDSLKQQSDEGTVVRDVLDFQMHLDVSDVGLSRTLLQYGVREEVSTNAFRRELKQLKNELSGEIGVLEVGANIGYYALLEATVLGERSRVFAVEPAPRNVELLEQNIELNGVTDRVSVRQLALGPDNGQAKLHLSEESNWHSVNRISDHQDSMAIDMMRIDEFLSAQGISTDQIHVIRADLEGFEVELFQEMDPLLASDTPLLLFVELHPSFRDAGKLNQVVDKLEKYDFDIVSTTLDVYANRFDRGWHGKEANFETFDELRGHIAESDTAVELIVKKRFT